MRNANRVKLCLFLVLLQIAAVTAFAQPAPSQPATRTLVRTGHLLDVKTGAEPTGQTIIVTGDRITAIAPTASTPKQPGDIDPYFELSMTPAKEGIIGVENAKVTLEAGFTTVRNVGADDFADVALRDEINAGRVPGPHMQVSGPILGITGGHADENLLPWEYHVHSQGVADGIPAVQHQVRENIKYGADLIKIAATGGVLSKGDDPQASQYTLEEMQAIVADAHRLGRKVAAHAHGAQGILWATEAGVDSIEHGSYINDECIAAMKKHGTYLVPTAYLVDWMQQYGHLPALYQQKMTDVSAAMKANHKRAIAAGVKIALGTDAAVYPHGLNAHELDVYVNQYGMSPLAAIQTGTLNAADLMGWTNHIGALEPGKWADIIAIDGDPLKDVKVLQHVNFVMKSGVVYKDETHKP